MSLRKKAFMKDRYDSLAFSIRTKKIAVGYSLFVGVLMLIILPMTWIVDIEEPAWLVWLLRCVFSYFLFEIIVMLSKPVALECLGAILNAKYLISAQEFSLLEVAGYSTLHYSTRYGIKNSVVLYLKSGKTIEFSEVMMNEITPLKAVLEGCKIPYFGVERSFFFTNFPFRRYN